MRNLFAASIAQFLERIRTLIVNIEVPEDKLHLTHEALTAVDDLQKQIIKIYDAIVDEVNPEMEEDSA